MFLARSPELNPGFYDQFFNTGVRWRSEISKEDIAFRLTRFVQTFPPQAKVLDMAAGAGLESQVVEQNNRCAYPIDASIRQLSLQQEIGKDFSGSNGFLSRRVLGNIFHLPFRACSFDAVCCANTLENGRTSERGAILAEIRRVLRPGGRVFLVTELINETIMRFGDKKLHGEEAELLEEAEQNFGLQKISFTQVTMTPLNLERLLEYLGFKDIIISQDLRATSRWTNEPVFFTEATRPI